MLSSYQATGGEILRLKPCEKVPMKVGRANQQVVTSSEFCSFVIKNCESRQGEAEPV